MWLEAIITEADLVQAVGQLLPLKIYLQAGERDEDKDRWLLLHAATGVTLVSNEGLRVTCPAELSWSIAGMSSTMKLDALRIMIRPGVVEKKDGNILEINAEVEQADFRVLPGFVDSAIAQAVNSALAARMPAWNFTKTLTHTVDIGKNLDPVEALSIQVAWGKTRIGSDALTLVVSFKLTFVRNE